MNKNILLGIVVFGGLVLTTVLLPDTPQSQSENIATEETTIPYIPDEVVTLFPIYPNTDVLNINKSTGEDGRIFHSFSLDANSSISDINTWYREAFNHNGWSIKSDKNVAGYQIIQAEKENLFTSMQATNGNTSDSAIISQQTQIRPH
ncbi:hypothetical protein H6785_02455 [Candidatus Nomurabacteria bacterium]|nr:hypothetical protein [Candidatus Kaiserbacteria bacterium]MCB9815411.1 hypothetical protein [Candidatus Nomurabacteria bacterium]